RLKLECESHEGSLGSRLNANPHATLIHESSGNGNWLSPITTRSRHFGRPLCSSTIRSFRYCLTNCIRASAERRFRCQRIERTFLAGSEFGPRHATNSIFSSKLGRKSHNFISSSRVSGLLASLQAFSQWLYPPLVSSS